MNKNMLKICFVIALTMSSISAYGASTISSSISMGGGSFSPSNKVSIYVAASGSSYAAYSKHTAGDRVIGCNSSDPKMFYKTTTISSNPPISSITSSDAFDTTNWTSL
jgi:hypothetical protein